MKLMQNIEDFFSIKKRFNLGNIKMILPSPSSLAHRTTRTYFTKGIKIKVYRTSDKAPRMSSFPFIGAFLNMTLKVYNGLIPTSPKTTPMV